jgi:hypothetical protein
MHVIPTTQEAEIKGYRGHQSGQVTRATLSQKTHHKKRAGGVDQGVGRIQSTVPQKERKR